MISWWKYTCWNVGSKCWMLTWIFFGLFSERLCWGSCWWWPTRNIWLKARMARIICYGWTHLCQTHCSGTASNSELFIVYAIMSSSDHSNANVQSKNLALVRVFVVFLCYCDTILYSLRVILRTSSLVSELTLNFSFRKCWFDWVMMIWILLPVSASNVKSLVLLLLHDKPNILLKY